MTVFRLSLQLAGGLQLAGVAGQLGQMAPLYGILHDCDKSCLEVLF